MPQLLAWKIFIGWRQKGKNAKDAAYNGARQVWAPISRFCIGRTGNSFYPSSIIKVTSWTVRLGILV